MTNQLDPRDEAFLLEHASSAKAQPRMHEGLIAAKKAQQPTININIEAISMYQVDPKDQAILLELVKELKEDKGYLKKGFLNKFGDLLAKYGSLAVSVIKLIIENFK